VLHFYTLSQPMKQLLLNHLTQIGGNPLSPRSAFSRTEMTLPSHSPMTGLPPALPQASKPPGHTRGAASYARFTGLPLAPQPMIDLLDDTPTLMTPTLGSPTASGTVAPATSPTSASLSLQSSGASTGSSGSNAANDTLPPSTTMDRSDSLPASPLLIVQTSSISSTGAPPSPSVGIGSMASPSSVAVAAVATDGTHHTVVPLTTPRSHDMNATRVLTPSPQEGTLAPPPTPLTGGPSSATTLHTAATVAAGLSSPNGMASSSSNPGSPNNLVTIPSPTTLSIGTIPLSPQ
jgi:hypothetical protein